MPCHLQVRLGPLKTALLLAFLLQHCPLASAQWPGIAARRRQQQQQQHSPRKPPAVCSIVRFCPDPILTTLGVWKQHQRTTSSSLTSPSSSSSCTTLQTVPCTFYTVCNLTASAPTDTCTETTTTSTPCSTDTSSTTYWVSWSSPLPSPASYSYGSRLTPILSPPWPRTTSSTSCSSTESEIRSWPPSFATDSTTRYRHHSRTWRSIHSFHSIVTPSVPYYPTTTTTTSSTSEDDCKKTTTTHTTERHHSTSLFILPEQV